MMVSRVWSLSCCFLFCSRCPRAQSLVKVHVWIPCAVESAQLLWDSFTPKRMIKHYSHSIWIHSVTRTIFPVFALKVMHGEILLTWFCKLLTRDAILSGDTCFKCVNGTTPLWAACKVAESTTFSFPRKRVFGTIRTPLFSWCYLLSVQGKLSFQNHQTKNLTHTHFAPVVFITKYFLVLFLHSFFETSIVGPY